MINNNFYSKFLDILNSEYFAISYDTIVTQYYKFLSVQSVIFLKQVYTYSTYRHIYKQINKIIKI